MSQFYKPSPRSFFAMAASSFTGMILAIPIALGIYMPNNNSAQAQSAQDGATTAVAKSDYAMFAYAYSQGMLAASKTSSQSTASTCQEQDTTSGEANMPGMGSVSGGTALQSDMLLAPASSGFTPGRGNVSGMGDEDSDMTHNTTVTNAYNTYKSIVENSWNYINSNNTVGSYNTNTTSVDVSDSYGVTVGVSNDNTSTNVSNNDISHSSVDTTTTVDNSDTNSTTVNNTTETSNVNSGNTTTMVDSGNTTTNTTTTTNIDSNNTTTDSNNTTTEVNNVTNNEHNNVHNNTHNNEHDNNTTQS
jgi:hypothetical protein